jgi:hypothetical protein
VRERVDLGTRARLAAAVAANGVCAREPAKGLDALGEDLGVLRVEEEAMVDRDGARGSREVRRTEPCDAGFIAKTATLTSSPFSAGASIPGTKNRSLTPAGQTLLRTATVTCAMNSAWDRSNSAASCCSRFVPSKPKPTPTWSQSPSPTGSSRSGPTPLRSRIPGEP